MGPTGKFAACSDIRSPPWRIFKTIPCCPCIGGETFRFKLISSRRLRAGGDIFQAGAMESDSVIPGMTHMTHHDAFSFVVANTLNPEQSLYGKVRHGASCVIPVDAMVAWQM
jgi:hypothetical protein